MATGWGWRGGRACGEAEVRSVYLCVRARLHIRAQYFQDLGPYPFFEHAWLVGGPRISQRGMRLDFGTSKSLKAIFGLAEHKVRPDMLF